MLHIVVHKEAQTRGKDDAATPGPRFCCSVRPFAEGLCLIVRGRLLAGLIGGSSTHKEPKVCASKEDTILGRPNKEAAGVSGTALPEHSQHSGWPCLESKITRNQLRTVSCSARSSSTAQREARQPCGCWLHSSLQRLTLEARARCAQAPGSLFIFLVNQPLISTINASS